MSGELKAFQQRMAAAVMAPLTSRDNMVRRRPDGVPMAREAAAFVKPNDRLDSFERLEIYNRQYWWRLLACFEDDFPGVRALLGRSRFDAMARAYLAACPSTSFTLRNLGSRLVPWLRAEPRWAGPRLDPVLDMARLEWAHIEAFDAADLPVLTAAELAGVGGDTRLGLQPHVRLLHLRYPVDDLLVQVRRAAEAGRAAVSNAVQARRVPVRRAAVPEPAETFLAVHRHDHSVYYKPLAPEDYRILRALRCGAGLGDALDAGFQGSRVPEGERPGFLQQAFHRWASLGWFVPAGTGQDDPGGSHDDQD